MKCLHCGKPIDKNQHFCTGCGSPAPEVPPQKHSPIKIFLCIALVLSLVANLALLIKLDPLQQPEEKDNIGITSREDDDKEELQEEEANSLSEDAPAKDDDSRLEGNGFSSPEEAITAYVEAMRDGDVDAMIKTFAIESYVDCYNLEDYMNTVYYYDYYNFEVNFPNSSAYQTQVNHYARLCTIIRQIRNGYYSLTGIDNSRATQTFTRSEEKDIEKFLKNLEYPELDKELSRIKIGKIFTEEDFDYDEDGYSRAMENYSYLDVDDLCNLAIEFEFDKDTYYLFMLTAEINGNWYNITTSGVLGNLLGVPAISGGIAPKSDL